MKVLVRNFLVQKNEQGGQIARITSAEEEDWYNRCVLVEAVYR